MATPRTTPDSVQFAIEWDPTDYTDEQKARAEHLAEWMGSFCARLTSRILPKAIAYGSADLALMGSAMKLLMPQSAAEIEGQELAIWFYVLGKVARQVGSYAQGEVPDIDSWDDTWFYSMMAEHVREFGYW